MTAHKKAADLRQRQAAASKTPCTGDHNRLLSLLKGFIVSAAIRGLLPYGTATWLIQRGGLRHA